MNRSIYDNFINILKGKIPQRGLLTNKLVDILFIEKEAVYRRLRGEVPFTFSEIATISGKLNISLDDLTGVSSPKIRPFEMRMIDYNNPTETDYHMLEDYVEFLKIFVDDKEYSEFGAVSHGLPQHFSVAYPLIYRFHILKYIYQFGNPGSVKPFSEIYPSDRLIQINKDYLSEVQEFDYTYFIWDELLMFYFVNYIKYFLNTRLITQEETLLLKKELMLFLSDLEKLTSEGKYSSGKKVHIYISTLNFETNYSYAQAVDTDVYLTLIKTYSLNELVSLDKTVFFKMKTWIESVKRSSTLISESGEIQRYKFLEKQREFVDNL